MRTKLALAIAASAMLVAPMALAQARPEPPRPAPPEPRPAPPEEVRPPPPEPRPAPPTGREEIGEREFGNPGVIAIGGASSADFGWHQLNPPGGGSSSSDIVLAIAPDVQYFVIEGLSVGGTVQFVWDNPNQGGATTTFGIGPTVGYNVWLTPGSLSLWPQASFLFNTVSLPSQTVGTTTTPSETDTVMSLRLFVPLLIHPVKHFHFGVGPYFDTDISSKAGNADGPKRTDVGLAVEVAGWL